VPLELGDPSAALAAGIGMVHQHFTLAENITAFENITLGAESLFSLRRNQKKAQTKINSIMSHSGLDAPLDIPVGKLSVGERQRVEILKALYRDAHILVLDEPTAVLTPQEADSLFSNLRRMTKQGLSVIFITHKMREVLSFSDRLVVLRHGKNVGSMKTSDASEKKIARLMVGSETQKVSAKRIKPGGPILSLNEISVAGQSKRDSLHDVNLILNSNEILGIAGISGNGQNVLADLISGLVAPDRGSIVLKGVAIENISPFNMIKSGFGRIPEDRHRQGIVGGLSVSENMIIERLDDPQIQNFGFLRSSVINKNAKTLSEKYDVRGPGIDQASRLLSGGNIQKLILARVFEKQPEIILANQPTRGLDMGAASEVQKHLIEARDRGGGVILISEDLDEILGLADRIVVMRDGKLHDAISNSREDIGLMMAGDSA
jgi:simple sugar transport system ATP-binding protein